MKDLDSFTEGTAKGSFDSIPAASIDEHGQTIEPINSLSLSMLPPLDQSLSIEMWRADVHSCTPTTQDHPPASYKPPTTVKRPRSVSEGDDDRRIKARPYDITSPTPSHPLFFEFGRRAPVVGLHSVPPRSRSAPPD